LDDPGQLDDTGEELVGWTHHDSPRSRASARNRSNSAINHSTSHRFNGPNW
jgi:hypothetical protein